MLKTDQGRLPRSAATVLGAATLAFSAAACAADPADDGGLPLVGIGIAVALVLAVAGVLLVMRRGGKKHDPAAFMTLEQITRLDAPDPSSTLMRVAHPKPQDPNAPARPRPGSSRPASPSDVYMSELEKQYPRIVEKIITMWPHPDGEVYLQKLTIDERGDREGFSREIIAEIMLLYGVKSKETHDGTFWH